MKNHKNYDEAREFGDKHLSIIINILNDCFAHKEIDHIRLATDKEDKEDNADIMIRMLTGAYLKIAVRVRKYDKFCINEFTIRAVSRKSSKEVEWKKVKQGKGDYLFYAQESIDENGIDNWVLIDLDLVREFTSCSKSAPKEISIVYNSDGSGLVKYNLDLLLEYDPRAVVAKTF